MQEVYFWRVLSLRLAGFIRASILMFIVLKFKLVFLLGGHLFTRFCRFLNKVIGAISFSFFMIHWMLSCPAGLCKINFSCKVLILSHSQYFTDINRDWWTDWSRMSCSFYAAAIKFCFSWKEVPFVTLCEPALLLNRCEHMYIGNDTSVPCVW